MVYDHKLLTWNQILGPQHAQQDQYHLLSARHEALQQSSLVSQANLDALHRFLPFAPMWHQDRPGWSSSQVSQGELLYLRQLLATSIRPSKIMFDLSNKLLVLNAAFAHFLIDLMISIESIVEVKILIDPSRYYPRIVEQFGLLVVNGPSGLRSAECHFWKLIYGALTVDVRLVKKSIDVLYTDNSKCNLSPLLIEDTPITLSAEKAMLACQALSKTPLMTTWRKEYNHEIIGVLLSSVPASYTPKEMIVYDSQDESIKEDIFE